MGAWGGEACQRLAVVHEQDKLLGPRVVVNKGGILFSVLCSYAFPSFQNLEKSKEQNTENSK